MSLNNSCQNVLVNIASRSLTIEPGMPCKRTMLSKKVRATDVAEYGWPNRMKCAHFDRRSTMVSITDFPLMRGKPSMKSMATSSHTTEGTPSGCSRPATRVVHLCSSSRSHRRVEIHAPSRARPECGSLRGDDAESSLCPRA
jgi:hypothetical protein